MSNLLRILDQKLTFYHDITEGENKWVSEELQDGNIKILTGFIENVRLVKEFYRQVYTNSQPRIVLCGINPGRLGAGKTGVPFLDFLSLTHFCPNIHRTDHEKSAQFVYRVIHKYGKDEFFNDVYLTNFSWFGFTKNVNNSWKNVNYYQLSQNIQSVIEENFIEEMNIIQPKFIIPLSEQVERSLKILKKSGRLEWDILPRLKHPYYCSFNNPDERVKEYIDRIYGIS